MIWCEGQKPKMLAANRWLPWYIWINPASGLELTFEVFEDFKKVWKTWTLVWAHMRDSLKCTKVGFVYVAGQDFSEQPTLYTQCTT